MERVALAVQVLARTGFSAEEHLKPFVPARSPIVKVRCSGPHSAQRLLVAVGLALEKHAASEHRSQKLRAAAKRPPEKGFRRRVMKGAMQDLAETHRSLPPPEPHWAAGEINWQARCVLREVRGQLEVGEASVAVAGTVCKTSVPRALKRAH